MRIVISYFKTRRFKLKGFELKIGLTEVLAVTTSGFIVFQELILKVLKVLLHN